MKAILVISLFIGFTAAASPQQRSPVYQPRSEVVGGPSPGGGNLGGFSGSSTQQQNVNSFISKSSPAPPLSPPTPSTSPLPVVAEARESVAPSDQNMLQGQTSVNTGTPSQNYYVYYYPNQPGAQVGTVGQPNSSSIMSWEGWTDVAAGVGSLALVAVGSGILYSKYGQQAQTRALRELKDMSAEDAARMARGVLRALEKFSTLSNHTE